MAIEKIHPTVVSAQSPGALSVMPRVRVSGRLKTEKAYACPMERWMASAAGGMRHRG